MNFVVGSDVRALKRAVKQEMDWEQNQSERAGGWP